MPHLNLQTNASVSDEAKSAFFQDVAKSLSQALGKPENVFMAAMEDGVSMNFAGSEEPCAMVEFAGLGLPAEALRQLTELICASTLSHLGIPGNRVYVRFLDTERSHWGWDGKTFG